MNKIAYDGKVLNLKKGREFMDTNSATLATVTKKGRKIRLKDPVVDYGHRQAFQGPEFSLKEISVLEDVESMVRQSFQKKTALMFKAGEKLSGRNKRTIDYIKKRIKQIEFISKQSFRQLMRDTGYALISRSNFFWVKVRNENFSGGRTIGGVQPVAAIYGMGAEHVIVKRDKDGNIIKYRQQMPDGRYQEWLPRDIIHFKAYCKPGYTFGTPAIVPVKEDIRALRRIEENVELMVYQHLFPVFQYKVGTEVKPAGDIRLPSGEIMSEVDYVRGQIEQMPAEGGIVTPERHEISFIGAEKQVLKAKEYLDYFKQRVISGLGMSGVDIGEGGTANRATSESMSRALVDSVKDYQDILQETLNREFIEELLLESTFQFDVFDEEHLVKYNFKEVDTEEQMKMNTNAQVMYNGNVFTLDEARDLAGKEPLADGDEDGLFMNKVDIPKLEKEGGIKESAAANSATNSNRPTNQHGTKTGPQKSQLDHRLTIKDSFASDMTRMIKYDLGEHVEKQIIDKDWINVILDSANDSIKKKYKKITNSAFLKGLRDANISEESIQKIESVEFDGVEKYVNRYIDKFINDMRGKVNYGLNKIINTDATRKEIKQSVRDNIESIEYRADFIDRTERMRAYNYGKALGLLEAGYLKASIYKDTECEICKDLDYEVDLLSLNIESVPPYHPNSVAKIKSGIA